MASSEDLPNSAPRYLVNPADFSEIRKYLTDKIMIIDFTEAFRMSSPPPDLGIPENYLPPEAIFKDESAIGVGCDMWALACTLYEIRAQISLFYMTVDDDDLLSEMVCNFGKLPEPWWSKWQSRDKFFDKNGGRLGSVHMTTDGESWSLETCLNNKLEIGGHFGSEKKVFGIPADEQGLLADLIRSLCDYDPRKRPSVREVLQHEWFNA